jgi:hypothetical protein
MSDRQQFEQPTEIAYFQAQTIRAERIVDDLRKLGLLDADMASTSMNYHLLHLHELKDHLLDDLAATGQPYLAGIRPQLNTVSASVPGGKTIIG